MLSRASIAIVGGGLSGLYAAYLLEQQGIDHVLLEAQDRSGGRLLAADHQGAQVDLGATWFWPEIQPALWALVQALPLRTFRQPEAGDFLIDASPHLAPRRISAGTQDSTASMRMAGGLAALADALRARVPSARLRLGHRVSAIHRLDSGAVRIHAIGPQGPWELQAQQVLLALPPRLAVDSITFVPPLPAALANAWAACPTWMAPHAKYVALYPRPFWHTQGLSGAARSYAGPMAEIHDASPPQGAGALFGFIGIGASARRQWGAQALLAHCRQQMGRLFGAEALQPSAEWIKDWSQDAYTASAADTDGAAGHPTAPAMAAHDGPWQACLRGIGCEWSARFPGYVAGAVDAAAHGVQAALAAATLTQEQPSMPVKKETP